MSTYNTGAEKARKGGQSLSIKAATLNKLIEHLTWPDYNEDDKLYAKILLSCIDFIAPPTLVLDKFAQRFRVPKKKGMTDAEWERDMQQPIQSRVCSVLKSWVDSFASQLNDEFTDKFKDFLKTDLNSKVLIFSENFCLIISLKSKSQFLEIRTACSNFDSDFGRKDQTGHF